MPNCTFLKADRRSSLYRDFHEIFETLGELQSTFAGSFDLSPFDYTEQAAVSAFIWAAGANDRLALAEYQVLKSKKPGKKFKRNGRADLWIDFPKQNYSMEFKKARSNATQIKLRQRFDFALRDASCIDPDEHDVSLAVLIAYVSDERRLSTYAKFADEDDVKLAVRIGDPVEGSCFIYIGTP